MKSYPYIKIIISYALGIAMVFAGRYYYRHRLKADSQSIAYKSLPQFTAVAEVAPVIDQVALKQAPFVMSEPLSKSTHVSGKGKSQQYLDSRAVVINAASITANTLAKQKMQLPLFGGEMAMVDFTKTQKQPAGSLLFEGTITSANDPQSRRPASLLISGDYAEGNFSTKSGRYRILTGPAGKFMLVQLNPKLRY